MLEVIMNDGPARRASGMLAHRLSRENAALRPFTADDGPVGYVTAGIHLDHLHHANTSDPAALTRAGVTSWTLGIFGTSLEEVIMSAARAADSPAARAPGFAGLYLEGPYLSGREGPPAGSLAVWRLLDEIEAPVAAVVFAPEAVDVSDFVPALVDRGIRALVGYTECAYEECLSVFEAGACGLCLPFVSTRAFHHREPGPIGAALESAVRVEAAFGEGALATQQARILARSFGSGIMPVYHPGRHPGDIKAGFPEDFCSRSARSAGMSAREFLAAAGAQWREGRLVIFDERLGVSAVVTESELRF